MFEIVKPVQRLERVTRVPERDPSLGSFCHTQVTECLPIVTKGRPGHIILLTAKTSLVHPDRAP